MGAGAVGFSGVPTSITKPVLFSLLTISFPELFRKVKLPDKAPSKKS